MKSALGAGIWACGFSLLAAAIVLSPGGIVERVEAADPPCPAAGSDPRTACPGGESAGAWAAPADSPQLQPSPWHSGGASPAGALPEPIATFADVPPDHWAFDYVEALYAEGYIAGCSADPRLYCPEASMYRSEGAVFVERGIRGSAYLPPPAEASVFADVGLGSWYTDWVMGLWNDGYTAGCGTDPLIFCPQWIHSRAESAVFFERMLHEKDYLPPESTL